MDFEILIIVVAIIIVSAVTILARTSNDKRDQWVSVDEFQKQKLKIKPHCSEEEFMTFMQFLQEYKGGYVRRRSGQIVYQDYLGKEKGDLKGIFFNIIVPNPNLKSSQKEWFRKFLISIGVNGVSLRPAYETRDSKLRNNKDEGEEYRRKEVGNKGEQIVRDFLKELDPYKYSVINGPVIKMDDVAKEYDHIIVGRSGVFAIETKAFGMTDGVPSKASLFIDSGDKWIIRKNKNNRELTSPSKQVMEEKEHLENVIKSCPVVVHPVLVLSNTKLFIKNNIELPYDVVRADKLEEFIMSYKDNLTEGDKMFVLQDIDECRIN